MALIVFYDTAFSQMCMSSVQWLPCALMSVCTLCITVFDVSQHNPYMLCLQRQDMHRLRVLLELLHYMPVTPVLLTKCQIAVAVKRVCASTCPEVATVGR
jgi:hypothetical protein